VRRESAALELQLAAAAAAASGTAACVSGRRRQELVMSWTNAMALGGFWSIKADKPFILQA
jgi:hypothetical protein